MLHYILVYQTQTDGEIELDTLTTKEEVVNKVNSLNISGYDYAVISGNIVKDFANTEAQANKSIEKVMEDEYPRFALAVGEGSLDNPGEYCCNSLKYQLAGTCRGKEGHTTGTDQCPDQMICYNGKFREYSLSPVGHIQYTIRNCPWCGHKFPESLRDKWYDQIGKLGLDVWEDRDQIPEKFKTDAWWKGTDTK